MRRFFVLASVVFAVSTAGAAEPEIPDLKGTWAVEIAGVGREKLGETTYPKLHPEKLGFHEAEFTLVIEKQEGFRFSGFRQSVRKKETVSGVFGFDNQSLYMVDDDGILIGRLVTPDRMELIYLHVTKEHSIASREILIRKRPPVSGE